jgi:hypothetical protein
MKKESRKMDKTRHKTSSNGKVKPLRHRFLNPDDYTEANAFGMVPKKATCSENLSDREFRVICAIYTLLGKKKEAIISMADLAKTAGKDIRRTREVVSALRSRGIVTTRGVGQIQTWSRPILPPWQSESDEPLDNPFDNPFETLDPVNETDSQLSFLGC